MDKRDSHKVAIAVAVAGGRGLGSKDAVVDVVVVDEVAVAVGLVGAVIAGS